MSQIKDLQNRLVQNFKNYEAQGTKPWDHNIAAFDLQYQIGNLSKALLQLSNHRYKKNQTDDELKLKIADELADTIANVLYIAAELNIDIEKALEDMFKSDEHKIKIRSGN